MQLAPGDKPNEVHYGSFKTGNQLDSPFYARRYLDARTMRAVWTPVFRRSLPSITPDRADALIAAMTKDHSLHWVFVRRDLFPGTDHEWRAVLLFKAEHLFGTRRFVADEVNTPAYLLREWTRLAVENYSTEDVGGVDKETVEEYKNIAERAPEEDVAGAKRPMSAFRQQALFMYRRLKWRYETPLHRFASVGLTWNEDNLDDVLWFDETGHAYDDLDADIVSFEIVAGARPELGLGAATFVHRMQRTPLRALYRNHIRAFNARQAMAADSEFLGVLESYKLNGWKSIDEGAMLISTLGRMPVADALAMLRSGEPVERTKIIYAIVLNELAHIMAPLESDDRVTPLIVYHGFETKRDDMHLRLTEAARAYPDCPYRRLTFLSTSFSPAIVMRNFARTEDYLLLRIELPDGMPAVNYALRGRREYEFHKGEQEALLPFSMHRLTDRDDSYGDNLRALQRASWLWSKGASDADMLRVAALLNANRLCLNVYWSGTIKQPATGVKAPFVDAPYFAARPHMHITYGGISPFKSMPGPVSHTTLADTTERSAKQEQ